MTFKGFLKKIFWGAVILIATIFVIGYFSDDEDGYEEAYADHYGYSRDDEDYDDDEEYWDEDDEDYDDYDDEGSIFSSISEKYNYLKELFALEDEDLDDDEDYTFFEDSGASSGKNGNKSSFEAVNVPKTDTASQTATAQTDSEKEVADWTVLCYLCGSDLESSWGEGINDINQMLQSKRGKNVNVVIQTGGSSKWHGFNISSKKNERLVLTDKTAKKVYSESTRNMGKPETLSDFIKWAKENYPAKHYILDFWNHGGGSVTGVCFDELFEIDDEGNVDSLTCSEVKQALSDGGVNFDLFIFDCCLSATIEIADALQNFGKYMVASEEFLIGGMMSYDKWLTTISETPDINPAELAVQIAKYYATNMTKGKYKESRTIAALDLSKIDMVKLSFQAMAGQMTQKTQDVTSFKTLVNGVGRGVKYGSNSEKEGYTNLIDLGEFATGAQTEVPRQAEAVLAAIKNAVLFENHGKNEGNSCGIAVYYPVHYSGDTDAYADNVDNRPYLQYLDTILDAWKAPDWVYQDRRVRAFTPVKSKSYKLEFNTFVMNPDSECNYALKITSGLESVKKVTMCLFWYDEEAKEYLYLGSDDDVNADWKKGIFYDNFDASWFSIGDSYINADLISQSGPINTYTVPIELNGKETNLRFTYDKDKDEFEILGAFDGTSGGASAKGMRKFKKGDKIDFIFDAISDDENDDEEYSYVCEGVKWEDGINVEWSELLDGLYYYQFEIEDIFGNVKETDFTEMEYKDGEIYLSIDEDE